MFSMTQIGINISRLRKKTGITQMEMANKLGISFQAVSNWERGISMPDISKLEELSMLFNVSIDEILGNQRASEITSNVLRKESTPDITMKEIEEVAPLLHEEQVESLIDHAEELTMDAGEIAQAAPFLSQSFLDDYARKAYEKEGLKAILPIAPFISAAVLDACGKSAYEKDGIQAIAPIAPFMSGSLLNALAKEVLQKEGLGGLSPILPFVSRGILEEYIMRK